MRVRHIWVTKLVGRFHHDIPLNVDDHVTIIHGPNGFGKTSLLGVIEAFFKGRNLTLDQIPFEEFGVGFDNGNAIRVTKTESNEKADGKRELKFSFSGPGMEPAEKSYPIRMSNSDALGGL